MFFFQMKIENTNINNGDFYYVRLRQQTLSLGSVDLRQQNNLIQNYCKPPPPPRVKFWLTLSNLYGHK